MTGKRVLTVGVLKGGVLDQKTDSGEGVIRMLRLRQQPGNEAVLIEVGRILGAGSVHPAVLPVL